MFYSSYIISWFISVITIWFSILSCNCLINWSLLAIDFSYPFLRSSYLVSNPSFISLMSFCCSSTLVSYSLLLDDFRLGAFLYESRSLFRALTSLVNDLFSSFRFFTVCRLSFSLCSSILIFCSSLITSTFFTWRFLYMSILVASSFLTLFLSMCTLSLFVDIESFNIRISSFLLLMSCNNYQLYSSRLEVKET